jgi:hypothetical protein
MNSLPQGVAVAFVGAAEDGGDDECDTLTRERA